MHKLKQLGALLTMAIYLTACGGGGGGGTDVAGDGGPDGGTGVAVDPYIVGAVFEEVDADGNVLQVSSSSDVNGKFTFSKPFTNGSMLVMSAQGFHNGAPFNGQLKRKVDDSGLLVASPLTTLLAEGLSEDEVVGLIAEDTATEEEKSALKAKLKTNPMAGFAAGDRKLLVASIAVNAALVSLNSDLGVGDDVAGKQAKLTKVRSVVKAVADLLEEKVFANTASEDDGAKLGAAVAISDFVTTKIAADNDVVVGELVGDEQIDQIVAEAEKNQGEVVIEEDEQGKAVPVKPEVTVAAYLAKGFEAFSKATTNSSTAAMLSAVKNFNAAAALVGIDGSATQNDKDTALFFGSMARVMALAKPYSDNVDNGLNNLGDILDAFEFEADRGNYDQISYPEICEEYGYYTDESGIIHPFIECHSRPLSEKAPTGGKLQKFLFAKLGAELKGSIAALEKVGVGFKKSWADPVDSSVTETEFDYADALFLKAIAQTMLAQVNIQQAYDLDVDIYTEDQDFSNESLDYTTEDFLANNPSLGRLKDTAKLAEAKGYLSSAADDLLAAIAAIEKESDGQADDFINFYTETYPEESEQDIVEAKADIAKFKKALTERTIFENDPTIATDDEVVDFSRFFEGIDLRDLVPEYTGDTAGFFPDPTMGGILVDTDMGLNQDLDEDGSPDFFEGYTQFSEALISGKNNDAYICGLRAQTSFAADGSFIMDWYDWTSSTSTIGGHWEVREDGSLILSATDGEAFSTAEVTVNEGDEDGDPDDIDFMVTWNTDSQTLADCSDPGYWFIW